MEFATLRGIIADQLGIDEDEITMESSFSNDLGADSIDLVEIVMALEAEYGFEVPEDEVENIDTVAKAVEYIKNNA